jgi:hypothetical protein
MFVKVIQIKRNSLIWAVKVDARYKSSYMGHGAKERAMEFAKEFGEPEIVELPEPKRPGPKPGKRRRRNLEIIQKSFQSE